MAIRRKDTALVLKSSKTQTKQKLTIMIDRQLWELGKKKGINFTKSIDEFLRRELTKI